MQIVKQSALLNGSMLLSLSASNIPAYYMYPGEVT